MGIFTSKEEKEKRKKEKEERKQKINNLKKGVSDCLSLHEKKNSDLKNLKEKIIKLSDNIKVISIQNPFEWEYETLSIVSSRSTMGTGFWSEGHAFWSDILGTEDSSQNAKINKGEKLCFSRLKQQCALMGGNAIIGVDIDYSEIGSTGGTLSGNSAKALVCAAGTSVVVKNRKEVFSEDLISILDEISSIRDLIIKTKEDIKLNTENHDSMVYELREMNVSGY